ncbi:MAG: hypothetical protein GX075_01270 [Firmicutes bacterium]|nr:hypothetical protein [Bacillota bacterium]
MAAASDLDKFEKAATTEKTKEQADKANDDDDDDDSFLFNVFEAIFWTISMIYEGSRMSLARIEGDEGTDAEVEIRRTGEATLPFFQYDHRYLRVNSDIDARDNGLEIGYGPYAFS